MLRITDASDQKTGVEGSPQASNFTISTQCYTWTPYRDHEAPSRVHHTVAWFTGWGSSVLQYVARPVSKQQQWWGSFRNCIP